MKPMKLDIQMFAPDIRTVDINVNFKDISEDELPENLIIAFDTWEVTIPISGLYTNYVWNHQRTYVFDTISIVTEGYSIIAYQQGYSFIDIDVYKNNAFTRKIIDDNTINQSEPNFSQVATTNEGMFSAPDNDGTSCYFRGAVTNNYVKFANFWWRIIRINGDGSVRLIYQGDSATGNGQIGTRAFNTNRNDNAYVGYMYGTPGSTTYEATHANVNNSSIKTTLDNWYESNLSNYSDYIDTEAGFWGDRIPYSGSGIGRSATDYGAGYRLYTNKTPSFKCTNNSDLYTTSESSKGNKALSYPIGLISADEVAYAGGVYGTNNTSYYLYTNSSYWTMSPYHADSDGWAWVFRVHSGGYLISSIVPSAHGVRPVINLRGDLSVTGTGTWADPYEVSLPVVPITNFNGTELTNIYYNGTEISKMYCNGMLVFEKEPTVYKRRIMVGDDLKNRNIYSDFSENFSNELINYYSGSSNGNIFISPVNSDNTIINKFHDMCGRTPAGDTVRVEFSDEHVFYHLHFDGTVEINNIFSMSSDINYEVGEVVEDSPTYRHLYIEDPNIRPIQVGDKITENTKFYFNFPDDYDVENNQVDTLIKLDNDNNKRISITNVGGSSSGYTIYFRTSAAFPGVTGDNSAIFFIGSTFINKSSIVVNDIKTLTGKTGYFNGTVTYIDATHSAYQHILVDTTTLGA